MMTRIRSCFTSLLFFTLATLPLSAQWNRTGGPGGGIIYTLLSDGNRLYAGMNSGNGSLEGGLFVTTDTSMTWKQLGHTTLGNYRVQALLKVGTVLLAGTQYGGIYRSTDDGTNWNTGNSGLSNGGLNVSCLLQQGHYVYAGTYGGGIFQSADTGKTWFTVNGGLPANFYALAMAKTSGYLFVKAETAQYRSADSGATWQPTAYPPATFQNGYFLAAVGDSLYTGVDLKLYKSGNAGNSWHAVENWPVNQRFYSLHSIGNEIFIGTGGAGVVRMNNDSSKVYAITDSGLAAKSVLALTQYKGKWIAGTERGSGTGSYGQSVGGGVYLYLPARKSWRQSVYGLYPDVTITQLSLIGTTLFAQTDNAAGNVNGLFYSEDEGKHWLESQIPANTNGRIIKQGNDCFTVNGAYGISKSTDLGKTWSFCNSGLNTNLYNDLIVNGNTILACSYGGGIWRTSNAGVSWQSCSAGLPVNAACYRMGKLGTKLFVGLNGDPNSIYMSTNNGNSWSAVSGTDWGRTERFFTTGTTIFAGSNMNLYKSTDNGVTWTVINNVFANGYPYDLAETSSGVLILSKSQGFAWSSDLGVSWHQANQGLGVVQPGPMVVSGGKVFSGTQGVGVIWRNASEFTTTAIADHVTTVSKWQCLPNPVKDRVRFQFAGQEMQGKVQILDTKGRVITTGTASDSLDLSGLPPGVYLARITSQQGLHLVRILKE